MTAFFSRPRAAGVFAILAALGFVIYANAIRHPFVHDDIVFITLNPDIARWDNIWSLFTHAPASFPSMKMVTPYYRPLLEVFSRLEYLLFGMNPAGFHAVNVVLHVLNSYLVFFLIRAFGVGRKLAFAGAVIFLVHPAQSEAVACISGISNLLVAFFILLAFLSYVKARNSGRRVFFIFSLSLFLLGLVTKEQTAIFPFLLAAYEWLAPRKKTHGRFVRLGLVFLVLAGYLFMRFSLFGTQGSAHLTPIEETTVRLLSVPRLLLTYLQVIFWPVDLHYYRSVDILLPKLAPWLGLLFITGLTWLVFIRVKLTRRQTALLGLVWAGLLLLPGLNIYPLVNEYSLVLAAEHFVYLPMAGILTSVLVVSSSLLREDWRRTAGIALGILVVLMSGLTVRQNTFWADEIRLFERTVKYQPDFGRVHLLLGKAYLDRGRTQEAWVSYTKGLRIMEDYVRKSGHSQARKVYQQFVKSAYFERGIAALAMGNLAGSTADFRQSLKTAAGDPDFADIDSRTANNLGFNMLRRGDRAEARRWWQIAVKLDASDAQALTNLGMLALERHDQVSARLFFNHALKVAPGFLPAAINLKRAEETGH